MILDLLEQKKAKGARNTSGKYVKLIDNVVRTKSSININDNKYIKYSFALGKHPS